MTIGEKIKHLRKSNNMTLDEVADKISCAKNTISRYENNLRTPKINTLIELANIFNVSLDYFDNSFCNSSISTINFGDRLKLLREDLGLTQKELASVLLISPSTIGMYEQNYRMPDSEMLIRIADLFKVSVDYLLGRVNPYVSIDESKMLTLEIKTIVNYLKDKKITQKKMKLIKAFIDALFDDEE